MPVVIAHEPERITLVASDGRGVCIRVPLLDRDIAALIADLSEALAHELSTKK